MVKALSDELKKIIESLGNDCPEELLSIINGNSSSQKSFKLAIVKELIHSHYDRQIMKKDIKFLNKMVWAIFGVTFLAWITIVIKSILEAGILP